MVALLVLGAGQLACVTPEAEHLGWTVRFACSAVAARAERVLVSIAPGDCAASTPPVYKTRVVRGDAADSDAPGALPQGEYAFRATALDSDGAELAGSCRVVNLPSGESVVLELVGPVACSGDPSEPDTSTGGGNHVGSADGGADAGHDAWDSAAENAGDASVSPTPDASETCSCAPCDCADAATPDSSTPDASTPDAGMGSGVDSGMPVLVATLIAATPVSGGRDTWSHGENWDLGAPPSGAQGAVIAAGITAWVDSDGTPTYSGGLRLEAGASLNIGWTTKYATISNALGTGPIVMEQGSVIITRAGLGDYDFAQGIRLEGDATIWAGKSTQNHWTTKTFSGGIQGSGTLIYNGVNGTWFAFKTANPRWTGGLTTADPQTQPHGVRASADGCFGTGDVAINNNCTLVIAAGLSDTIDDAASLSLNGEPKQSSVYKLTLNSNETVHALFVDGAQQPAGTYRSSAQTWITGQGILTVLTGP